MDRLPPLNAVRAFEAVARNMSISLAAEELHVTPGAISRQVQLLESHLNISLLIWAICGRELIAVLALL